MTAAAGPRPAVRVQLLGELSLQVDGTPLPPLDSGRAESLLAYLLLHSGAPRPRQRLAFLLWPDSTEAQARTNLRHVLHHLRRALPGDLLDVTPRTLGWRADAPCWTDVEAFEEALSRRDVSGLREAAALYGGDLLPGNYGEWLVETRDDLRRRHLDGLARLAELLEERGELAEAVAATERLVQEDPLREEAYQMLMRLHGRRGDRARALRTYHACAAMLERELGVEPAAATRAAHDALLATDPEEADTSASRRGAGARRPRHRASTPDDVLARRRAREGVARARDRRAGRRQDPFRGGADGMVRAGRRCRRRGARLPRRRRTRLRARRRLAARPPGTGRTARPVAASSPRPAAAGAGDRAGGR